MYGKGGQGLRRSSVKLGMGLKGTDAEVYSRFNQWAPLAYAGPLMRQPKSAVRFVEEAQERFNRARGTELQKTLAADLGSSLCNDMLVKVNRASMACSLEVRVPFLDHRVVEFGLAFPNVSRSGRATSRSGASASSERSINAGRRRARSSKETGASACRC